MKPKHQVVFVTVPDGKTASKLAKAIIRQKLAACVNIVSGVKSVYWWKEKIETSKEELLMIKTKSCLVSKLICFVKHNHPYSIAEVIALDITSGNADYLKWIDSSCKNKSEMRGISKGRKK
ncbi:MAG TPA: divalent-cation tolerance protein CutA [Elusimicrobiales bacterium]|nr:divalent-cation tolerance protein CutA [Elusimicrobiales bacterium]